MTTWALLSTPVSPAAFADPCSDIAVVFARGTHQDPGLGNIGQAFVDSLTSQVGGRSVGVYAVNYPASPDFPTAMVGIQDAANHITQMAASCTQTKEVLGGFSQGGAVSLYAAPRMPARLAGVLALSCYLPLRRDLAAERRPENDGTPIFMAHGIEDPMLPLSLGSDSRDALSELGYTVEWHQYRMGHAVCPEEIADIRHFLLRVLP